jgi:Family of unknown function (DUF6174)
VRGLGRYNGRIMNRSPAYAAALLLAAVLPACTTTSPDDPGDDVLANRRRWQSLRITDYQVQFRTICFCTTETTAPVILQVRGGAITSATRVADGAAVPPSAWTGRYYTVDQVFDLIVKAKAQGAFQVRVTYDALLGYPTGVFIDYRAELADEEQRLVLAGLTPAR